MFGRAQIGMLYSRKRFGEDGDPGFLVVRECVRNGIEVQCLPGATAFVPALVASGLPNEKFCFEGFLPQKKGRMTRLKALAEDYSLYTRKFLGFCLQLGS